MQYEKTCHYCNTQFTAYRKDKRFCSDSCRALYSANKDYITLAPSDDSVLVVSENKKVEVLPRGSGYVYIVKDIEISGYYKIGCSRNLDSRLNRFGVMLPFKWELIHTFKSSDVFASEKVLHEMFSDKHKTGEWYELSDDDVNYLKKIRGI